MLGERIQNLRKANYMTQSELAVKVDTDSTTISRWETNRVKPGQKYILKLAKALHTTADYLLGETDEIPPTSEDIANSEENNSDDELPYTKESEKLNRGMLSYTLKDGTKIELPPIKASYEFLKDMALSAARVAVL
ncbi:MAG: helix-turn-helix transcriptional regulator [Synergistaceae bacterium]|nr:helix-turn-helix transcriptional regulator [Synergistaceae bacterium]